MRWPTLRSAGDADPEADKKLDDFLAQPYVIHVQVDQDVAMEARRLLRAKLPGLRKPYDAIHLASAVWHDIETFHTFDRDDLLPLNGLVKCQNGKPMAVWQTSRSAASGAARAALRWRALKMPRPKLKPDNPEQFKRFLEAAREIGADPDNPETFDRVLEEVARSSRPKPTPKTRRPRKPKDRA